MSTTATCGKCDGTGRITGFEHIENGVCFACGGSGTITVSERTARRNAAQEAQRAHRKARWDAFAAVAPELAARIVKDCNGTGAAKWADLLDQLYGTDTDVADLAS